MSDDRECKACHKKNQEYYPNRRTCKVCVLAKTREVYEKIYAVDALSIKCKKCDQEKHSQFFPISSKTHLRKEICTQCRKPAPRPYIDDPRFIELEAWFKSLKLSSTPDDMNRLRYIVLNN